jgi:hypothetical protein
MKPRMMLLLLLVLALTAIAFLAGLRLNESLCTRLARENRELREKMSSIDDQLSDFCQEDFGRRCCR